MISKKRSLGNCWYVWWLKSWDKYLNLKKLSYLHWDRWFLAHRKIKVQMFYSQAAMIVRDVTVKIHVRNICKIYNKHRSIIPIYCSCNNVAPVTNLCLGRATTRSHSWNVKTHYLRFKHFIITITDDPSPC